MGLDAVELVMEWEAAFDVRIPNAVAEKMLTPNDVADWLIASEMLATEWRDGAGRPDRVRILAVVMRLTGEQMGIGADLVWPTMRFVDDLGIT